MAMNQEKRKPEVGGQIEYMGRWVDKKHFCAFVYNDKEQKLAKTYDEFHKLISSGMWFVTREDALNAIKKAEELIQRVNDSLKEPIETANKPVFVPPKNVKPFNKAGK